MSGDLAKGCTEIDFFNGYLIKLAGERACPVNQSAYALVKRMEQERLMPALRWLDEMVPRNGAA
jgi:ketopantoate reductase